MARPVKQHGPRNALEAFRALGEQLTVAVNRPNVNGYKPHAKQVIFHSSSAKKKLYIIRVIGLLLNSCFLISLQNAHSYYSTKKTTFRITLRITL